MYEAIISKDDWKRVQSLLEKRISGDKEVRLRNKGRVLSILKDLVFCEECGRKRGLGSLIKNQEKVRIGLKSCKNYGSSGLTNARSV